MGGLTVGGRVGILTGTFEGIAEKGLDGALD